MDIILRFIADTFDTTVLILFLISGIILIFLDSKQYKKDNMTREYKFTKAVGIIYIVLGTFLYILGRYIKI